MGQSLIEGTLPAGAEIRMVTPASPLSPGIYPRFGRYHDIRRADEGGGQERLGENPGSWGLGRVAWAEGARRGTWHHGVWIVRKEIGPQILAALRGNVWMNWKSWD